MIRRVASVVPLVVAVALVAVVGLVGAGCADERPHLFLITSDTLRADHTSLHGYARPTTPHLEALAADGTVFEQAVTLVPKTGPSFATHFTGQAPERHGVTSNRYGLPAAMPVAAELLAAGGYTTVAFVANPILARRKGFDRGFDRYDEFGKEGSLEPQMRAFLSWARQHDWSRPAFVWIHYIDPHGPYDPPARLRDRFVGDALFEAEHRRVPLDYELPPGTPPNRVMGALPRYQRKGDEDRVAWYVSQYDAEIMAMDEALGSVLAFLRARDLYAPSGIVFTSDHGESLGEHDYWFEHGWHVYEGSVRVPLVLKPPGARGGGGRRIDAQVSNLDTLPTLLSLAGLPVPSGLPGRDLLAVPAGRPLLVSNPSTYPERFVAVRTPEIKYIRELGSGAEQTYRLADDPGEERDRTAADPALSGRLREQWQSLRDVLGAPADRAPAAALAPSDEERRQLEHLGYLDD
jgi:arylsulfatase